MICIGSRCPKWNKLRIGNKTISNEINITSSVLSISNVDGLLSLNGTNLVRIM